MDRRRCFAIVLTALLCLSGKAQHDVGSIVGQSGKSTIATSGLLGGGTAEERNLTQVLGNDLNLSDHFLVQASPAEFEIKGRTVSNGSTLQADIQVVSLTGAVQLNQRFSGPANQSRALAHEINDAVVEKIKGVPGIATTRLALIGKRTGSKELFVCDYDGENLRQVTSDRSISEFPRWFPDGSELVYTTFLKGNARLARINPATGQRSLLSSRPGINIGGAVSPDGRRLASILSFEGRPEVYVQDIASGRLTRITSTKSAAKAKASWSPDGLRLVFVSEHTGKPNLFIAAATGGQPTQITTGLENVGPDWGPHGWIAHARRAGGRYEIVVLNPNTRQQEVVSPGDADYEDPSWARDGRHIVCKRTSGHSSSIVVLDTKAGVQQKARLVTRVQGDWTSPDWTP